MSEEHKMSSTGLMWESRRDRAKQKDQTEQREEAGSCLRSLGGGLYEPGNGGSEAFC